MWKNVKTFNTAELSLKFEPTIFHVNMFFCISFAENKITANHSTEYAYYDAK